MSITTTKMEDEEKREEMRDSRNQEGNEGEVDAIGELMVVIESVGSYVGFRRMQRKECFNLVRRLKLLVPLLEELRELNVSEAPLDFLSILRKALLSAKKLLKYCNYGSKIYLAYESEVFTGRFHKVYDKLSSALDDFPYEELGISEEVKEQVELMHKQLKRAKRRVETQDMELAMDLMLVFSKDEDSNSDTAVIERLAKKMDLYTIADLKIETRAVRKLAKRKNGPSAESLQKIIDLLGKFKNIAGMEETNVLDNPASSTSSEKGLTPQIPHEFLCPITLEIMTDPVIVATGQTYERESIKKWLNSNHQTCPKSGQTLVHLSLAPNFALRNLILQWCEKNDFKLPKKEVDTSSASSAKLLEEVSSLVENLYSNQIDVKRDAALRIRMLSKENPDNRILIANSGGIPPLVQQLSNSDCEVQEHTVTALLNLSINEKNKKIIASEGAIPTIVEVLQNGSEKARENSAAALFSLSMLDENKVTIGCLNGIPPLVTLLKTGTLRGKKDAATALFNLCLNQANKSRAVNAGIIPPLLNLLEDKNSGMIDGALSILSLVASHPEGRSEIGKLSFIETLVEIIRNGTPKNKEFATAVLLELGLNNSSMILAALQYGVYEHLSEISRSGTNRAQRKANSLLQHMIKCEHI